MIEPRMDQFNYLAVLISIILGLGITQLLSGVGRLLQARGHVRLYWPTLAWVAVLLVVHVQTWWAMFGLRTLQTWTFAAFCSCYCNRSCCFSSPRWRFQS